ncbi:hypothetical protein FKP32DRAFT_1204702 [Trametes sanguinea]|nr:hypothetical protein FKP32DRAFT_1204702 [Trametes sanguinea]
MHANSVHSSRTVEMNDADGILTEFRCREPTRLAFSRKSPYGDQMGVNEGTDAVMITGSAIVHARARSHICVASSGTSHHSHAGVVRECGATLASDAFRGTSSRHLPMPRHIWSSVFSVLLGPDRQATCGIRRCCVSRGLARTRETNTETKAPGGEGRSLYPVLR